VKILCKEDVHICRTNFAKQMEQNLHETTSRWKTYEKRLFSEDLEVRDVAIHKRVQCMDLVEGRTYSSLATVASLQLHKYPLRSIST
jgi:hypothetical protein